MIKNIFKNSITQIQKSKRSTQFIAKNFSQENNPNKNSSNNNANNQKANNQKHRNNKRNYNQNQQNTVQNTKIGIEKSLETLEKRFNIQIKETKTDYQPIQPTEQILQKIQKNEQKSSQNNALKLGQKVEQGLNEKRQNLLKNLQKIEIKNETFNQVFDSNQTQYLSHVSKIEGQKRKDSEYQLNEIQKKENGVDIFETDKVAKKEIANFILQKDRQQEQQILSYLGFTEFPNKIEQLKQWRENQQIENIDFTPETMGVKEVFYPGSKKGPAPIDDMENFGEWYKQNMPKPYQLILNNLKELHEVKIKNQNAPSFLSGFMQSKEERTMDVDNNNPNQFFAIQNPINQYQVSEMNSLSAPLIEDIPDHDPYEVLENVVFDDNTGLSFGKELEEGEIPVFPEFTKGDFHYSVELIEKWSIFRLHPMIQKGLRHFQQLTQQLKDQQLEKNQKQVVVPTLYAYYYTLPKELQENMMVKTIFQNLENHKHDMSLQDKQLALNFACKMTMPIHPLVEEVLEDILTTEKYWVTAAEEELLLNRESPLEQEGEEEIKISSDADTSMKIQQDWQRPDRPDPLGINEPIPNLPIQYYDNDDGFWDWHIQEKQQAYGQVELPSFRPFFKH